MEGIEFHHLRENRSIQENAAKFLHMLQCKPCISPPPCAHPVGIDCVRRSLYASLSLGPKTRST